MFKFNFKCLVFLHDCMHVCSWIICSLLGEFEVVLSVLRGFARVMLKVPAVKSGSESHYDFYWGFAFISLIHTLELLSQYHLKSFSHGAADHPIAFRSPLPSLIVSSSHKLLQKWTGPDGNPCSVYPPLSRAFIRLCVWSLMVTRKWPSFVVLNVSVEW